MRIRIRRKGYVAKRDGTIYRVKPTTYTRKAKGKCPYCRAPVFARGIKHKGKWYHKSCYYVAYIRIPRR